MRIEGDDLAADVRDMGDMVRTLANEVDHLRTRLDRMGTIVAHLVARAHPKGERNVEIYNLWRKGARMRDLALKYEVSHARIGQICRKQQDLRGD